MFNDPNWKDADPSLGRRLVNAVNRKWGVVGFEPAKTSVRVLKLPFYSAHNLFELSLDEAGQRRDKAYVVFDHEDDVHVLDWRANTIYALNEKAPLLLPDGDDPDMEQTVFSYLRFFCNFLEGDDGPFFLVERPDDLPLLAPLAEESRRRIEPLRLKAFDPKVSYDIQGIVLYGTSQKDGEARGRLFVAELRVHAQPPVGKPVGFVEMLDDNTLELDVKLFPRLAERRGEVKFLIERPPPVPIMAEQLEAALKEGRPVINRIVEQESIDFRSMTFQLPVVLRNCVFRGGVDFSLAHFDRSVELTDCTIDGCFVANGAQVGGTLSLAGTTALGRDPTQRSSSGALALDGAVVHGDLLLSNTKVNGSMFGRNLRVEKQVLMDGVQVSGFMFLAYAQFAGLSCTMDSARPPASIGADLELGGVQCPGYIRIEGVQIGGALSAISSKFGTFILCHGWREAAAGEVPTPPVGAERGGDGNEPAAIPPGPPPKIAVPAQVREGVYFDNTTFDGRLSCTGLQIEGRMYPNSPTWMKRRPGAFMLNDCRVEGDVVLHAIRAHESAPDGLVLEEKLGQPQIHGKVSFAGSHIRGEVDLRGLSCGGAIELSGARVGANLLCTARHDEDRKLRLSTDCAALNMQQFTCEGDVNLSGLYLVTATSGDAAEEIGHVNARACTISGQLCLFDAELHQAHPEAGFARIPGSLNLTSARANHLILSGESFDKGSGLPPAQAGIVFQHATFRRFQLHSPPLPTSLDLGNISVEWWDFGEDRDHLQIFRHLLKEDLHKYRSTFLSIEQSLFNQGHAESAEQVRKWMYNHERGGSELGSPAASKPISGFQSASYAFWEWFGYGRTRFLVTLFLVALLVNTWLFMSRDNVWPGLDALQSHPGWTQDRRPEQWGIGDAFWLAARQQVPMVGLAVQEEWRTAGRRLTLPGLGVRLPFITAEDWGGVVSLLAWIWWPLLLLSITGIVRRAGLNK